MKTLVEMGIYTKYNNIFTNEKIKQQEKGYKKNLRETVPSK